MLTFEYKAATTDGGTVSGILTGSDRQAVAEQLHTLGHIPIRIDQTETRAKKGRARLLAGRRVSDEQIADFTRDLSTLLRAGIALDQALVILNSVADGEPLGQLLEQIHDRVKSGSTLADAVEEHDKVFSRLYVNMLRAGESGGALETVLERLSDHLAKSKELRDALVSA